MNRTALFLLLIVLFFSACEEVYRTELDNAEKLLVINAKISSNSYYNSIKLTTTTGFWSEDEQVIPIDNAHVSIIGEDKTYYVFNTGEGNYLLYKSLEPNKPYKLRVIIEENVFESDWEVMPPLPEIDNFYVLPEEKSEYSKNVYGDLVLTVNEGFQVSMDIPVNLDSKYYRFTWKSVLPFMVSPPPGSMGLPYFIWLTVHQNREYNLASLPEFFSSTQIHKHPLMFMKNDYRKYYDPEGAGIYEPYTVTPNGWIFEINQFSINENAYAFYSQIEDQLNASGRLFDPVLTQIYGNIKCVSDSTVTVLGNFELNSVRKKQYFVKQLLNDTIYYHEIDSMYIIPDNGVTYYHKPFFWQSIRK